MKTFSPLTTKTNSPGAGVRGRVGASQFDGAQGVDVVADGGVVDSAGGLERLLDVARDGGGSIGQTGRPEVFGRLRTVLGLETK